MATALYRETRPSHRPLAPPPRPTLPPSIPYTRMLRRYADFGTGVASRAEYWLAIAVDLSITAVLVVVDLALLAADVEMTFVRVADDATLTFPLYPLTAAYVLATALPILGIGARRLRATNRSGWWQLLFAVPVVGWIVLAAMLAMPSVVSDHPEREDDRP